PPGTGGLDPVPPHLQQQGGVTMPAPPMGQDTYSMGGVNTAMDQRGIDPSLEEWCKNNPQEAYCGGEQTEPEQGNCGEGLFMGSDGKCHPDPNWVPPDDDQGDFGTEPTDQQQCQPGYYWHYQNQQCVADPTGPYAGSEPTDPIGGGGGGLNPDIPGNQTVLPSVDPYATEESRDWMNIFDYGGENANVNAINPQAQDFAYDQVNDFSDAAWQNSMRYIEPQMELQNERFDQELINKGIDPQSEAGKRAYRQ
ncbi:unnamed protein product, partial [marine sediment metagenome]